MEQQSKDTVLPAASAATHPSTPAPTEPPRRPAPAGRSAAVDGIRGIGVMTVLLYHAGVTSLAGAFLDMDMFFVTSGMLITMLLLREYKRRGRLPLLGFWLGRARRLLPGLFAVLTVVGLHGYFLADPTTLTALRQDMLSTLGFFANWHFINDDATYFTAQSVNSPLIHMWSLAIEEQFYLVWPIFLMLWLKVRRGSVRGLPTVLALLALASAIYMAWLYVPGADPSKVYFNTFARAQSLMIGCIVGIWITRNSQRRIIPAWPAPVGMIALVAMVVMPLAVDSQSAWIYHGGFLAVSVMAALLGASVFTDRQSAVARLTRLRPLPWLGRLTYGLYIWHWPIFVILDEDRTGLPFLPLLALRLGVTILVAHLFDRFVDAPIHAGALSRWKVRTPLKALVAAGTAASVVAWTFASTAHAAPQLLGNALPGAVLSLPGPMLQGQKRVVILGDSVAYSVWRNFPAAAYPDVSVGASIQLGCGVQLPLTFVWPGGGTFTPGQCEDYTDRWKRLIETVEPDVVVLMATSAEVFDLEVDGKTVRNGSPEYAAAMTKAYLRALDVAGGDGTRTVLVPNLACSKVDNLTEDQAKFVGVPDDQILAVVAQRNDPARQDHLNAAITAAVKQRPFARVLDERSYLCPQGVYLDRIDNVQLRQDGVHFTPEGAEVWWRRFLPELRAAMSPTSPDRILTPKW